MESTKLQRLKDLLSVPSKTYKEVGMVNYILSVLSTIDGVSYHTDSMNNIYAVKGTLSQGEYYPMFIAHTDTVHELVDEIVVKEETLVKPSTFGRTYNKDLHFVLKGYRKDGSPTGIGGDDKNGVFIALELLRILPKIKVGLFVSEETGCHGSSKCEIDFLSDVGYAIQFDAPGNHLITEICSGTRLFEEDGDFINLVKPLFETVMNVKSECQSHPYTDITQIKRKSDFSTINLSCGYYNMHTTNEFVVVDEVESCIELGIRIVDTLGLTKHSYPYDPPTYDPRAYGYQGLWNSINEDEYYDDTEHTLCGFFNDFSYSNDILTIKDKDTGNIVTLFREEVLDLIEFLSERLDGDY